MFDTLENSLKRHPTIVMSSIARHLIQLKPAFPVSLSLREWKWETPLFCILAVMKAAKIFLLLIALAFGIRARGQKSIHTCHCIKGTLIDSVDNQPIPFANVSLLKGNEQLANAITDINGKFKIDLMGISETKNLRIKISYEGYKEVNIELKTNQSFDKIKINRDLQHIVMIRFSSDKVTDCLEMDTAFLSDSLTISFIIEGDLVSHLEDVFIIKHLIKNIYLAYKVISGTSWHYDRVLSQPTKLNREQVHKIKKLIENGLDNTGGLNEWGPTVEIIATNNFLGRYKVTDDFFHSGQKEIEKLLGFTNNK